MKLSIKLIHNHDEIIANCPELDISCYGSDRSEAIYRIKKVINFYMESARELGLEVENLNEISIDGENKQSLNDTFIKSCTNSIN